jgi:hypothetical protein
MNDVRNSPSPLHAAFIILGVVIVATLVCGGALYVGDWWMHDAFPGYVRADIETNPMIIEHIGTIEELALDFNASSVEPGENVFVFTIRGPKGRGRLRAEVVSRSSTDEDVVAAELLLESGEKYQLFTDHPLP